MILFNPTIPALSRNTGDAAIIEAVLTNVIGKNAAVSNALNL